MSAPGVPPPGYDDSENQALQDHHQAVVRMEKTTTVSHLAYLTAAFSVPSRRQQATMSEEFLQPCNRVRKEFRVN